VTLGSSGAVAYFGLRHARFAPGESVLVRGAAGGIGITAVQLATRDGAGLVAVTTSSAERGDRLRELGATHVLDRAGQGGQDVSRGLRRHHRRRRRTRDAFVLRPAQAERAHGGRRHRRGSAASGLRRGDVRR
jgi:NADPH:quinone reductase-like Zn-dependent oxidoreductase